LRITSIPPPLSPLPIRYKIAWNLEVEILTSESFRLYRPNHAEILNHNPKPMINKGLKPLAQTAACSFL
jgi:hypothetical protein